MVPRVRPKHTRRQAAVFMPIEAGCWLSVNFDNPLQCEDNIVELLIMKPSYLLHEVGKALSRWVNKHKLS